MRNLFLILLFKCVGAPSCLSFVNSAGVRVVCFNIRTGDVVSIFTPDDSHFSMTCAALEAGCRVMVAKPLVLTLAEHHKSVELAREKNRLLLVEVHKRFDPIYADKWNFKTAKSASSPQHDLIDGNHGYNNESSLRSKSSLRKQGSILVFTR